ncbi:MAG: acetyl-CoA carboxylase carboxyl transferase subunit beta [Fimbriimonadaceae bacterium]|jgi:acetyl-CoA carboxylase carboxyl transferase subunit beta|nr:acetyl-CoA carboxylase carboxyl transferase subunit beta [Fimbriimonadaceae bacterium]
MLARKEGKGDPNPNFVQCQNCRKTLFATEFEAGLRVCPYCGHHHRLSWRQRINYTFDPDSFIEQDQELSSLDPLSFPDYAEKHAQAKEKTNLEDSVVSGTARLEGVAVSVAVADFGFMGGSMGSVAGEKITRALERGVAEEMPVIIFCASGGARMQEGLLSLMQMAKTTAAVENCRSRGVPFLAVFTDPTMAGVLASYASVADVILAEPKALVGFAGARVSKQAQVVKAPDDFQLAEWVQRSGMLDRVVERREMRSVLNQLVQLLGSHLNSRRKVLG